MKIIVDAFGGDNAPLEILKGCQMAVEEYGVDILLTGSETIIRQTAQQQGISLSHMEIFDAPDVIATDASPKSIMREKKDCSLAAGLKLLADGKGDAFISAGNSGALVFGTNMIVRCIPGIKRIAFAPVMPKREGFFMLCDGGANVECRADMLVQFGIMGSAYLEKVMGVKNPRVGLANVGTEDHKGGTLQHETFALLQKSGLNFVGNVEARDIPGDGADVIVADGFTGNVILKLYEGVAMELFGMIKELFSKNLKTKLAASLVLNDMRALKKRVDYNEYGGAPIIGAAKPVFKAHGSAKAKTFKNAIRLTKAYVEGHVIEEISEAITDFEQEHGGEQA